MGRAAQAGLEQNQRRECGGQSESPAAPQAVRPDRGQGLSARHAAEGLANHRDLDAAREDGEAEGAALQGELAGNHRT